MISSKSPSGVTVHGGDGYLIDNIRYHLDFDHPQAGVTGEEERPPPLVVPGRECHMQRSLRGE